MKKRGFEVESDGFYGFYWENKKPSKAAMIAMLGDDASDSLSRCCVKWLQEKGLNVLTMSPARKDYSHHNYPLERMGKAVHWLLSHGNEKVGIVGASTTGTLALTAASYFPEITLTFALTPSDFIWQGFAQGKRDGCGEWPIEGNPYSPIAVSRCPICLFVINIPSIGRCIGPNPRKAGI